jgi:hypothetical protein
MAVAFATITILLVLRLRGATLAALQPLGDEKLLLETDRLTLQLGFESESLVEDAFVRITDRRVLFGTGSLQRPQSARVQLVGLLDGRGFGCGVLEDGYVTFPVRRVDVALDAQTVRITSRDPGYAIPRSIAIACDRDRPELPELLRDALTGRLAIENRA